MKKNLIMGVIKNYGWLDIEPFFVSWEKNCGDSDCVMFYSDISEYTLKQLSNMNSLNNRGGGIKIN